MSKLFKTKLFIQIIIASLTASLAASGIVAATTTIGSNIDTGGTLTITSTTATSTLSTGGLTIGTNQFVVQQNSGYVGVGTSTPTAKLTIQGTATEASLGSELITATADRDFSSDSGQWTGTGWTVGSGVDTHTAGANALTLDNTALSYAPASGNVYQITFTVVTTVAGTLTPSIGGVSGTAVGQSTGTLTAQTQVITATGAGALIFTPDANWTGTIDNVSVKQITTTSPLVTLQNSNGSTGLEMRSSGAGLTNSFIGIYAGQSIISGSDNVAFGWSAFKSDTTGQRNTALGFQAMSLNTTASYNVAVGYNALYANTTGASNTALGFRSMRYNVTGGSNTATGVYSLQYNTTGNNNTANGNYSLYLNTIGSNNTALGYYSGYNLTTGSSNIIIGYNVNAPSATADQQLNIGNLIYGIGVYNGLSVSATAVTKSGVGISTTTPYAKLSVQGTDVASTTLAIRPVASQTANILDIYSTAGVLNSVIDSSNRWGIGTTTPASLLHVSAGANATTTVEFGEQSVTSKTCFNVRDALGAATSFYFVGTTMVVEANRCR